MATGCRAEVVPRRPPELRAEPAALARRARCDRVLGRGAREEPHEPRRALPRGGALRRALKEQGVVAGDRVAAYMPNLPETVVAMLAAASMAPFHLGLARLRRAGRADRFGRPSPRCWWPATATITAARRWMCSASSARSSPSSLGQARRGRALRAPRARPLARAARVTRLRRPLPLRDDIEFGSCPSTTRLHHVLLGTTGVPRASWTAPAARCSTSRSTSCTAT